MSRERYNRAIGIAEFIIEGHTLKETMDEFGVKKDTISRDLVFLAQYGYGEEAKRNQELYRKAKIQLLRNSRCHTTSVKK